MTDFNRRQFIISSGKLTALGLLLSGCKTMDAVSDFSRSIAEESPEIDQAKVDALLKGGQAIAHSFENFTPEQEYYIGRTIGALVLDQYPVYNHSEVNFYLNILGQSLAQYCSVPETFAGYHFLALDSGDINAMAAPGGFIFVTRGLMQCCRTEDSLAGVLAHEIAHVQAKHGLQAIKQARITNAFAILGLESARNIGSSEISELTETFGQAISDISQTLIKSGYSRTQEYEADAAAVALLNRVGYDSEQMIDMLLQMEQRLQPGGIDFAKTHPSPSSRIKKLTPLVNRVSAASNTARRQNRFDRLAGLI